MANTPNLNLNKPQYGAGQWDKDLNENFDIIDTAIQQVLDGQGGYYIGEEPPLNPRYGQVWIDTSQGSIDGEDVTGLYKIYNGDVWDVIHVQSKEMNKKWDKTELQIAGQNLINDTSADWQTINNNGAGGNGNYLLDSRIYFEFDEDYVFQAVLRPQTKPVQVRGIRYRKNGDIAYSPTTEVVEAGETKRVILRIENKREEFDAFQLQLMNIKGEEVTDEYLVDIREMKLEQGSIPTIWTPSLKDNGGKYSQTGELISTEHLTFLKQNIKDINNNLRIDIDKPLKVQIADKEPPAEDGKIYYNNKEKLFYISRDGQWYRFFVAGDEKLEQDPPAQPILKSKTDTTVELEEQENMEYRYQGGAWQEDNKFAGLNRNETYKFEQRFKADEIHKVSPPSPALTVRTDKGTQNAPSKPTISNLDYDRVTVSGGSGTEVKLNSGTWHSSPHTFTGLNEETKYTAYARRKETNTHKPSLVSAGTTFTTPSASQIWGVMIDTKNANPETRVKYIDDAVGFKPIRGNNGNVDWGSWKDTALYDNIRPCVVKNRQVQYYLDKNDLTKKATGGNAVLTGADGDVMIEISKLWLSIRRNTDGLYVRVSDGYQAGFSNMAFKNGDKEVERIYVGQYLGYEQNGKLRSVSGVEPTGSKTIGAFRELAEANGDGYHLVPIQPLILLQTIMTIMLKSTDTQTALGRGYVNASSFAKTGYTNSKGMMYGTKSDTEQMAFLGIEDFWGNKRWWIDGCKYDDGQIKIATKNFNNDAKGYITAGEYTADSGYIKDVIGGDLTGFIPKEFGGSSSTYYCDYSHVADGRFPRFGGDRSDGSTAGGFYLYSSSASYSDSALGARLFAYGE